MPAERLLKNPAPAIGQGAALPPFADVDSEAGPAPGAGQETGATAGCNGQEFPGRERLIAHYLPYARMVAASYYRRRLHDEIEFAEYLQLASLALLESIDRFDPSLGVQFKTFAARRMHGGILSGLEKLTEKQQQIACRRQLKAERLASLKRRDKKPEASGPAPDALFSELADIGIGLALAYLLEGTGMIEAQGAETESHAYYRRAELRQLQQKIRLLVDDLPEREREVVRCHYLQDMPFADIAAMSGLSKGRIAQIHRQAMERLRSIVRRQGELDLCL